MAGYVFGEGPQVYRIRMPIVIEDRGITTYRYRPPSIPLFDYMRNYFNGKVGGEIYRKQMMLDIIGAGYTNQNTIDTYRSYFTGAGYLMLIDRGYYHVLKEIPHGMILADLRWEASRERKKWEKKKAIKRMYVTPAFIEKGEFNV